MEYTGERCIPGRKGHELTELEHRSRYAMATERVAGQRVLDVGSGAGFGSGMLADKAAFVLGVELSEEAVRYAENAYARPNVRFLQADACSDSFVAQVKALCPEPFDAVTCFEVIEHVHEPLRLLRAVKELLKPGGLMLVTTPDINYSLEADLENPFHVVEYTRVDFRACLGGFFKHVNIAEQSLRIISEIGFEGDEARTLHEWRSATQCRPKYWVAACSDDETTAAPPKYGMYMSDGHLRFLQARLKEVRLDQQVKAQHIQLLEARVKDLADGRRNLATSTSREIPANIEHRLEQIERGQEKLAEETINRHNHLRRDFEGFKNHPAVRRLMRFRGPGLKMLGLFGLGFWPPGSKKK